jgi:nitrate/TMAO reductase-like tetraheme cytochrome c subunit
MLRLPGLGPDSALGRWVAHRGDGRLRPRGARVATLGAGLALGLLIVAALLAMQASSTPTFCGTCHIMKPYYRSWKQSAHNHVACVDCHISPGIGAELRKKYEALSMVVKYFTVTYGTKPWAEVDDASCLRCHERRLIEGRVDYDGVIFDHRPHLTESRKGIRLRCTSCHSQVMVGTHIAVTPTTCALCHFQGQPVNEGTARCRLCHAIPSRVATTAGTTFDHREVARFGMECSLCHGGVIRGTGEVPRIRCLSCHNQPERLARYGETDELHDWHVSRHKVECTNCHMEIDHGTPPRAAQVAATHDAGACGACHGAGHDAQQDLYAGIGGRGVPDMPGPMAAVGVTCQGCHNAEAVATQRARGPLEPVIQRADAVSCMTCHGPAYGRIFAAWQRGVAERVAALQRQMEASVGAMGLEPPQAWQDARHNFLLVSQGKGVHNVNFAFALLDQAWEQMNEARRARSLAPLPRPWRFVGASSGRCLLCHSGVEAQRGPWEGKAFDHGPHLLQAKLECAACHRTHEERRAPGEAGSGEVVRFGPAGCIPCHHQQTAAAGGACLQCHPDVSARTVRSFRGDFSHKAHLEMELQCGDCHNPKAGQLRPTRAACAQCHQD